MSKNTISFIILVVVMAILPFAVNAIFDTAAFPPLLSYGIAGLGALCLFTDGRLQQAEQKRPAQYVAAFMGLTAVKLFATIIFIAIVLYLNRDWQKVTKVAFAVGLFVAYMTFQFFQLYQYNKRLKKTKAAK